MADGAESGDAASLIHWLADRDEPCPLCKYNLRGLTRPVCPECGNDLRLRVTLADPFLTAWIAAIAVALPGAGIGCIFLLVFVHEFLQRGTRFLRQFHHMDVNEVISLTYVVAAVPVSVGLLMCRRKFLALPRSAQNGIATAVCASAALALACFLPEILR